MEIIGPKLNGHIIDGRALADAIKIDVRKKIVDEKLTPGLAIILVGEDPASHLYVNLKKKACFDVGIEMHLYKFPVNATQAEVLEAIQFLNQDEATHAILVQLPLPKQFNEDEIISAIDPKKDVDGFHKVNLQNLKDGKSTIISPLVLGINRLIEETQVELKNKNIVVLSNNPLFAEPFQSFYGKTNTVTSVTLQTPEFKTVCHEADILIVAVGKANFIDNTFIKEDGIVIDVGINSVNGKTTGDIDFDNVILKASFVSPVPGGVGPMTIAYLLKNTVDLCSKQ